MAAARKTTTKTNGDALHSRLEALKVDLRAFQKDLRSLPGEAGDEANARIGEAPTKTMGTVHDVTARIED
jgi:hypothetical protein